MNFAKFFQPKEDNRLEVSWQNWITFSLNVNPDLSEFLTLASGRSPLIVTLDLAAIDMNDEFIVIEEVGIERGGRLEFERVGWYKFKKTKPEPAMPSIISVASPDGKGFVASASIVILSPTSGPWLARVKIAQISGMQKQLRYMASELDLDSTPV